jgi:hypothetical protein
MQMESAGTVTGPRALTHSEWREAGSASG